MKKSTSVVIGLDIGTTSVCGVAWNLDENCLLTAQNRNNDSTIDSNFEWERIQDAMRILDIVRQILADIVNDVNDFATENKTAVNIKAIGLTGQMHGILYVDEKGNALSPLYTWQDQRATMLQPEQRQEIPEGYGYVTDMYNEREGLVPEGTCYFCSIASFVVAQLCSVSVPICHETEAASFGGFDVFDGVFKLKGARLPAVTKEFMFAGECLIAGRDVPVAIAIGDNQASYLGAIGRPITENPITENLITEASTAETSAVESRITQSSQEEAVLINVGTGSQVSIPVEKELARSLGLGRRNIELRPFFDGRLLAVGSALCGGRAYALLERFFADVAGVDNAYGIMNRIMKSNQKSNKNNKDNKDNLNNYNNDFPVFDTRFSGTRSKPELRGSIGNLSVNNFTPYHFICGMLEGMVNELVGMFEAEGLPFKMVVGSGNGIRKNPYMKAALEKRVRQTVKIAEYEEEAAIGAALFANMCLERSNTQ